MLVHFITLHKRCNPANLWRWPNRNIRDRSEHPHRSFIPESSGSPQWPWFIHDPSQTCTVHLVHTSKRKPKSRHIRLNRAKLPPSASWGPDRFPRPTISSGRKLGSYRRHLFGSGLRHPPWEEGGCTDYPSKHWGTMETCWSKNFKSLENKKRHLHYMIWLMAGNSSR